MSLTNKIAGICFIIFIIQNIAGNSFTTSFYFNPLNPDLNSLLISFVTSMFLHGGLMHLFFNMYALIMFGNLLEQRIGSDNFFKIYLGSGLVGNLTYLLTVYLGIIPPIPALGASGAIFGILGAVSVIYPNLQIFMMFVPIPIKIKYAAMMWIVLEFLGSFNPGSGIASAAHLGGLLFGILYSKYLINRVW